MDLSEVRNEVMQSLKNKKLFEKLRELNKIKFITSFHGKFIIVTSTELEDQVPLGVYDIVSGSTVPWHHKDETGVIDFRCSGKVAGTELSYKSSIYIDASVRVLVPALERMVSERAGKKLAFGYYIITSDSEDGYVIEGLYRSDGYWLAGTPLDRYIAKGNLHYYLEFSETVHPLSIENIMREYPPKNSEIVTVLDDSGNKTDFECVKGHFDYWYFVPKDGQPLKAKKV